MKKIRKALVPAAGPRMILPLALVNSYCGLWSDLTGRAGFCL